MRRTGTYLPLVLLLLGHPLLSAGEDTLGRLFMTAEERQVLDGLRHGKATHKQITRASQNKQDKTVAHQSPLHQKPARATAPATAPAKNKVSNTTTVHTVSGKDLYLSGLIIRGDGSKQVWVNGELLTGQSSVQAEIKSDSTVELKNRSQQQTTKARLKVGQKWHSRSNTVIEAYSESKDR